LLPTEQGIKMNSCNDTHYGIVLRVDKYHNTTYLLDHVMGRITTSHKKIPYNLFLTNGSLLRYHYEAKKSYHRIERVDVIRTPAPWAKDDILFLHHFLEMIYYFLPLQSNAISIFRLFLNLYNPYHASNHEYGILIRKKLLLAKFFSLAGIYPEHSFSQAEYKELFRHIFYAKNIAELYQTPSTLHKLLFSWLLDCVNSHPRASTFTTTAFLYTHTTSQTTQHIMECR
jgi:hypothetical protein